MNNENQHHALAADELRSLMREHKLTRERVAELTGYSDASVDGWLSKPGTVRYRKMRPAALELLKLKIKEGV